CSAFNTCAYPPPRGTRTRVQDRSMYSRIIGTGSYLPERVLTNAELEGIVDTTDEWILSRTGIERRHLAAASQTTCDLAEAAGPRATQAPRGGAPPLDFF